MYFSNECGEQRSNGKRNRGSSTCPHLLGRSIGRWVSRRRDVDAEGWWWGRRREWGVGRRRQARGRLCSVVHRRAICHDHDDQLLVAVAVVPVAADEVARSGAGEDGVAVGEGVHRRVRVARVVGLLVDEEHGVVAGLVSESCVHAHGPKKKRLMHSRRPNDPGLLLVTRFPFFLRTSNMVYFCTVDRRGNPER
jgi:hypothetical protein